jgi:hypothetical protein
VVLEGIRVLGREGDALADIFPSIHRTSFFGLNINILPQRLAAFLLLQDVASKGGIAWDQTGASNNRGRSAPWTTPCLSVKEQTEKEERNFPVFFPDFLMKPV